MTNQKQKEESGDEIDKAKYSPGPNAVDISPNKDGGVLKEIKEEGKGTALPGTGCTMTVHYRGTLIDGTVFDSSKDSGKPFEFVLGRGNVIKAWDIGVATMKKGEVAVLTCKPEYAYGANGSPPKIPPNSTLIFEITLIDWMAENISKKNDNGILRTIITPGKDYATPKEGALVEVHLTGSYQDEVFEDRDVSFNLGEGSEFNVIKGIEIALLQFKKEEKASLEIISKYAFKEEGHKEYGIPPNATVTYVVELKSFEKTKATWDMDAAEKLTQTKLLKEKATNYFKAEKYSLAAKLYKNMLQYVEEDVGFSDDENKERQALLLAGRLNLGLSYLKLDQHLKAKIECDKALELDPNNVKGLFRRGQASLNMSEPEAAKLDFEAVIRLEPGNKLAANHISMCCNKIKQQREREKKLYANMFEKFAQQDKEDSGVRFGWWDDKNQKPIIEELEKDDDKEEQEEMKKQKRKQLERLKEIAQARREELEKQKLVGKDAEDSETKEKIEEEQKKDGVNVEEDASYEANNKTTNEEQHKDEAN
ncbi:hypothetical protein RUM44_007747 [Polyplax serrata]|uniref:peptidylprolyl isomerase n=1 Tax=Polyplax serrata TaxID=468196 RepID=A0ABR1B782_POLSC